MGQCLAGARRALFDSLRDSARAPLPPEADGKEGRGARWTEAKALVKAQLRAWHQSHPGGDVPNELPAACEVLVKELLGARASSEKEVASFVRYTHLDFLRTEGPSPKPRSEAEWRQLFPRYPAEADSTEGYLRCFEVSDGAGIRGALETYGLCVVQVLSREECEATVGAMFEEINALRSAKDIQGPAISVDDPATWSTQNWPSGSKFLMDTVALHARAFDNRCHPKVYEAFCSAWSEQRLRVSVDRWGVARGAKHNRRWQSSLRPHWDLNPWQLLRDSENEVDSGYQGLIALRDQDAETGCHLTLPGCCHFLRQWSLERKLDKVSTTRKSFKAAEDDPILGYMQPVPLRQGQMLIWRCGQLHGSTKNSGERMRLTQFVRMFPAKEAGWKVNYEELDTFSVLRLKNREQVLEQLDLSPLGRKLLALDTY
ncbi:unnamed protein product [Effrenium voratum]|nr:unnamed protein product [Effrenium voratum]